MRPCCPEDQPTIRNMRVSVRAVLDLVEAGGPWAEILTDYPYLEREETEAAIAWAGEHPNTAPPPATR